MRHLRSLLRHSRVGPLLLTGLILSVPLGESAFAQKKQTGFPAIPRLLVLTPAGGQPGSVVEITASGLDLEEPKTLLCSLPGVQVELLGEAEAEKSAGGKGKKKGDPKSNASAARFRLTLPKGAPPGIHDLRVVGKHGLSNPRAFVVSDLPLAVEKEPNNDVADAQKVALNSSVHGAISAPTDVDYFLFSGKKGQRVVVALLASSIDSRLPAAVQIYRNGGALLATGRDYNGSDAITDAVLPAEDDYYVRVFAFTYTQGGAEHFYHLSITTAPWIDAVYPPAVLPGQTSEVTVYGRNLPGGELDPKAVIDGKPLESLKVKVSAPKQAEARQRLDFTGHIPPRTAGIDGFEFRLKNSAGASNPYLLTFAEHPVVLDNGDNDTPAKAQDVAVPCDIAGRVERKRDRDWYRFSVKKGETYGIELFGDRLGSPIDLYFTVRREDKSGVGDEMDDNPTIASTTLFFNRTEDPARYRLTASEDATYLLQIAAREADVHADARGVYLARIAPEQPDFRLIVLPTPAGTVGGNNNVVTTVPSGVTVPARGAGAFTVFALRDGYDGEIKLTAEGLPKGVRFPEQTIAAKQQQSGVVVIADETAEPWAGTFHLKGTAIIDEKPVVRQARAASITWPAIQNNATTIARLDQGLTLAVGEAAPYRVVPVKDSLTVPPNTKTPLAFKVERFNEFKGPVQIQLLNYANNVLTFNNNNQPLSITGADGSAVLDVKNTLPEGTYTLVFRAVAAVPTLDEKSKASGSIAVQQAALPVTLVVAKNAKPVPLAKLDIEGLSVSPNPLKMSAGMTTEVEVRVQRKKGDTTPLTVQLVPASDNDYFRPQEATIDGNKDRAKLPVRASGRTKSGNYSGLKVRVSAGGAAKDTPFSVSVK